MKILIITLNLLFASITLQAQVMVSTDFSNEDLATFEYYNIWDVANRISPKNGSGVRPDLKVNLVRMIGGIKKVVDGENVPDLDFDPCHYDSVSNTYVYNWDPLIQRLDKIVNSQVEIHQIVVDQPPWAFQHGYTFIPEGTMDSVHFREDERMTIYGNSLPPADKVAYHDFIKALMSKLLEVYGEEQVLAWRFRIGSEIETPDHWKGTEQDFIEHFANCERAIRAILPEAKIVVHTRPPDFIYKGGTVPNYTGEAIKSFANGLIEYCFDNNVRYDYWGISDYVVTTRDEDRLISQKYEKIFAPLVDHPKWNADAKLDLMEYGTITTMNAKDGNGLINCMSSHREIIELEFAQQYYKFADKGLESIYRWGNRPNTLDPINIAMLNTMLGLQRYETQVSGNANNGNNKLNAFFGKSKNGEGLDALVYNYNPVSMSDLDEEELTLSFEIDQPVGTVLYFRSLAYGKEHNKLQAFLENEPSSGWIKSGFDRYGDPSRTLNDAGAQAYADFVHDNDPYYTQWQAITTVERTDGKAGSVVMLSTTLNSFAFKKYEFRYVPGTVQAIMPTELRWTSDDDFQDFTFSQANATIADDLLTLSIEGKYPNVIYNNPISTSLYSKFRIVLKNETASDIFYFAFYKGDQKTQPRFKPTVNQTNFNSYTIDLASNANWNGTISRFHIETANKAEMGTVTIDSIELIPNEGALLNVDLQTEGEGCLNYSSGSCFNGQAFSIEATPFFGWEFDEWVGDVSSSENPLNISITEDMSIKAVFKEITDVEYYTLTVNAVNGTVQKIPDLIEYAEGQSVTLVPTANENFLFSTWSGDFISADETIILIMDSSINVTANFTQVTAINEVSSLRLNVFPNPSSGFFKLVANNSEKVDYKVYTMDGKLVESGNFYDSTSFEIETPGLYILRAISKGREMKPYCIVVQ